MAEKIVVANLYGGSNKRGRDVARWLRFLGARVAILCEIANLKDELKPLGQLFYNQRDTPTDVGILVIGRRPKRLWWAGWRLTPFIKRPKGKKQKLWRDRWVIRVRIWGRVYYSIHANAFISQNGDWLKHKGARVWLEALKELRYAIQKDINAGLRVRVGGDFNFPAGSDVRWSPSDFFDDLGLNHIDDGRVMYLAWDPRTDIAVSKRAMGLAPGADAHGSLMVSLKKRKRKERD